MAIETAEELAREFFDHPNVIAALRARIEDRDDAVRRDLLDELESLVFASAERAGNVFPALFWKHAHELLCAKYNSGQKPRVCPPEES